MSDPVVKPENWDEYVAAIEDLGHFYSDQLSEQNAFVERVTGCHSLHEVPKDADSLQRVIDAVYERIPPKPGRTLNRFQYETGCEVFPLESVLPALDRHGARLGMFNYGGVLVQILPGALGREIGALNPDAFAARLSQHIVFFRPVGKKQTPVQTACPQKLINAIFNNAARLQSIALRRIALTPIYKNGVLHSGSGYYAKDRLFLDAPSVTIPARDRASAEAALAYLLSWLEEFPFASDTAKSAGVALLLSAAMRASGLRCPGFLLSKPSYGAGASTLVDLAHIIMTGRQAPVINAAKSAVEIDKEIDSAQGHGRTGLALDNVPAGQLFNTTALAQTIQQEFRAARILGESRSPIVECSQLVTVTGVNVRLADDLVRRFVSCSLDPKLEQPETKTFKRPLLLQEAQRDRARILEACYTVIAAYEASGQFVPTRKIVGFDSWSSLISAALCWLGLPDPADSQEEIRADDPVTGDLHELLRLWRLLLGEKEVTATGIVNARQGFGSLEGEADKHAAARHELSELLDRIAEDKRGQVTAKQLGYWLKRYKRRVVAGWQLVPVEDARGFNNVGKWQLVKVREWFEAEEPSAQSAAPPPPPPAEPTAAPAAAAPKTNGAAHPTAEAAPAPEAPKANGHDTAADASWKQGPLKTYQMEFPTAQAENAPRVCAKYDVTWLRLGAGARIGTIRFALTLPADADRASALYKQINAEIMGRAA